jgi:diguanylate cyclase (GGDEF)-like protein/PAS domain S-box-containing protein
MECKLGPDIYRTVLENLPIGVYLTDRNRQITFWNATAERLTGYLGQEVIGHFCHDNILMHCDEDQMALCDAACPLSRSMQAGRPMDSNIFLLHKEGQRIPVRVHAVPLRDELGAIIGAAEFFEERVLHAAAVRCPHLKGAVCLDDVTGIPDRQATLSGLEAALKEATATEVPFGLLSVAVDNLDDLRRAYGRQGVEEVLHAVAQTLASGTRPEDLVGNWREDRFAVLLACPTEDGLRICAERLKRLISLAAVPWWGDRLSVTASMGGTMARPGDTVESLLGRAEQDLVAAAAGHTNSVLVV